MSQSKLKENGGEKAKQAATRDGYGQALMELGEQEERVVVLTADLAESTRVLQFGQKYPERFIECGVAEQNMAGIAAGLAAAGKIPWISSYAVFSPGRNWDQLRVAVAYSNLPVKIAGAHAGVSVGPDGATHQALEDIALMRVLPNMTVVVPSDAEETRKATWAATQWPGSVYVRFAREKTAVMTDEETEFEIGKARIVAKEGNEAAIVACGPLVGEAIEAAKALKMEGVGVTVVNNHTVKPMDEEMMVRVAKACGAVVTVEEHQVAGGMGSAVAEVLGERYPVPIIRVGMPDSFGESGEPDELLAKYGMNKAGIIKAVYKAIQMKKGGE